MEEYKIRPICDGKTYYTQSTTIGFETNEIVKTTPLESHNCKIREYTTKEKLEFYRNLLDELIYEAIRDGCDLDDELKIIKHMGDKACFPKSFNKAIIYS